MCFAGLDYDALGHNFTARPTESGLGALTCLEGPEPWRETVTQCDLTHFGSKRCLQTCEPVWVLSDGPTDLTVNGTCGMVRTPQVQKANFSWEL